MDILASQDKQVNGYESGLPFVTCHNGAAWQLPIN